MRMPHAHRCSTVCRCSQVLQAKIDLLARCESAVPTALAAPLLDMLHTEVEQLEKVLEVDTSQGDQSYLYWRITTFYSAEHRRLVRNTP